MSQLPRYESYKDSGMQWLGEIPDHWDVKQLKFAVTCNDEALGENTEPDYEILYVDISSVSLTDGIKHKEELLFEHAPSRARRVVKSGDVLVSTVRTYLKAITYVESAEENLIASTGFAVLRPSEKFDSKFIGYWIQSEGVVGNIVANSVGVSYPAINSTDLVRLPIVEVPLVEQKIIADFLDKRLAQVDALITKQEILLEKLAEQRVALISHAVTKGLNPDVEMKESGDTFFGKVPNHWDIIALHYIVRLISGDTITALDFVQDGDYPVYGGNGFRGYIDRYTHQGDYVLIGRQGALCGNINFATGSFFATEHAVVVNPLIDLNYKWLGFLLMAMNLNQYSTTAAQPGISAEVIGRLKILFPEIKEQNQIADYIENELIHIDELKNKAVSLKVKLKEYRSTLITQVITGKIDVRNLKAN
ncbi:restriction endonuclease subunit S [Acinetobacter calcoaceticus]|uniref:restriction endonuclease subunit S n=1 Tax=Acinetobacter calcoaceticus TaxID=471 RepID=UPI001E40A5F9|nr:restriction endonuclease subunit S [Acinetobacter calcoaceticus]UGQ29059.1 restriction endonuclease subunit S [Acinetobacter calcoaceticus]